MDNNHLPSSSDCPGDSVSPDPSVFSSFSSLGAKHRDNYELCYVQMHTHFDMHTHTQCKYGLVLCYLATKVFACAYGGEELVNGRMVVRASGEGQQQSTNYQIWGHSIVHQVLPIAGVTPQSMCPQGQAHLNEFEHTHARTHTHTLARRNTRTRAHIHIHTHTLWACVCDMHRHFLYTEL